MDEERAWDEAEEVEGPSGLSDLWTNLLAAGLAKPGPARNFRQSPSLGNNFRGRSVCFVIGLLGFLIFGAGFFCSGTFGVRPVASRRTGCAESHQNPSLGNLVRG